MKNRILYIAAFMLAVSVTTAQAACYADYKAKKDNPLQLHYGVIKVPNKICNGRTGAASVVERRLAKEGWTLLNVLSVFGDDGLERRKASAGRYFLRF